MFMLFLMIALQDIFGRELIISKDTIVTYTLKDNRKIAILLKQGEYDAALCKSLKNIIVQQDTTINGLKHTLYLMKQQANLYNQSIVELEKANKDMLKDLRKYIKRLTCMNKLFICSMSINAILLVLLCVL